MTQHRVSRHRDRGRLRTAVAGLTQSGSGPSHGIIPGPFGYAADTPLATLAEVTKGNLLDATTRVHDGPAVVNDSSAADVDSVMQKVVRYCRSGN